MFRLLGKYLSVFNTAKCRASASFWARMMIGSGLQSFHIESARLVGVSFQMRITTPLLSWRVNPSVGRFRLSCSGLRRVRLPSESTALPRVFNPSVGNSLPLEIGDRVGTAANEWHDVIFPIAGAGTYRPTGRGILYNRAEPLPGGAHGPISIAPRPAYTVRRKPPNSKLTTIGRPLTIFVSGLYPKSG